MSACDAWSKDYVSCFYIGKYFAYICPELLVYGKLDAESLYASCDFLYHVLYIQKVIQSGK